MIKLMDHESLLADKCIGITEIDIERRYFDDRWLSIKDYPIETRSLIKGESSQATGSIRLWIEIFDPLELQSKVTQEPKPRLAVEAVPKFESELMGSASKYRVQDAPKKQLETRRRWDIGLMPPHDMELRVIVWEVHDCPIDDPEGMTDLYVTCSMSSYKGGLTKKTDTHIRSLGFVSHLS